MLTRIDQVTYDVEEVGGEVENYGNFLVALATIYNSNLDTIERRLTTLENSVATLSSKGGAS